MARRQLLTAAVVLLVAVSAAPVEARPKLSKQAARSEGLRFVEPFVDMLDMERKVGTEMEAARHCRRMNRVTVRCQFRATLYTGHVVRSHVTVRLQKDGLIGFKLPLDVLGESV